MFRLTYGRDISLLRFKKTLDTKYSKTVQQPFYRPIMTEMTAQNLDDLPPLSRQDQESYARMAETMQLFHNSFRNTWKILYGACSSGKRPANMSIKQFLNTGRDFCHHLHVHHSIGLSSLSRSLDLAC